MDPPLPPPPKGPPPARPSPGDAGFGSSVGPSWAMPQQRMSRVWIVVLVGFLIAAIAAAVLVAGAIGVAT